MVIGNGFDLRTYIQSSFKDFIRFVTYGVIWHNYSKVLKNEKGFDFKILVEDKVSVIAEKQRKKEMSENKNSFHPLEILLEHPNYEEVSEKCRNLLDTMFGETFFTNILKDHKYFLELFKCDQLTGSGWTIVYGTPLSNEGNDSFKNYRIKLNLPETTATPGKGLETIAELVEDVIDQNSNKIALWSDVETVIEMLITKSPELKTKFNFEVLPEWNDQTLKHNFRVV